MRPIRLLFLCGSFVGLSAGTVLLVAQPGCTKAQCTQSSLDPNTPSPALECAAGLLCYQGQCIRACSAGQERAQACGGDGDCGGVRPNCIDGFCSACDQGELCVPTLNICQPYTEIIDDEPPPPTPPPGAPKPPAPLEPGWIDGGIKLGRDAGEDVPVDVVVTHAGLIDIAQVEDHAGGAAQTSSHVNVTMLYVGDVMDPGLIWRVDPWNESNRPGYKPSTETVVEEVLGEDCSLIYHQTYTASVATTTADFGTILIDSAPDFPGSLKRARIEVPFDGSRYVVPNNLESDLLAFSVLSPSQPRFLSIGGPGGTVAAAFPNPGPENGEHVPFELIPSADTKTMLANGANVSIAQPGDLVVRWDRIAVGSVPGEKVVLRFRTQNYEVNCQRTEGNIDGSIVVKAGLMASFISRANITAGSELDLYFERAYARRLEVPPRIQGAIIDVAARVRHTLIGKIRFQ